MSEDININTHEISSSDGRTLPHLQILRFVCALLVVICHSIVRVRYISNNRIFISDLWFHIAEKFGSLGVYTFFALSGFLITRQASNSFGKPGSSFRFMIRRCVRVVPLYWLVTFYTVWRLKGDIGHYGGHLIQSLLFIPHLPTPNSTMMLPICTAGWTLNYEMFFYAIFAVCLMFSKQVGELLMIVILMSLITLGEFISPNNVEARTVLEYLASYKLGVFLCGVLIAYVEARLPKINWMRFCPPPALLLVVPMCIIAYYEIYRPSLAWQMWPYTYSPIGACALGVLTLCIMAGPRIGSGTLNNLMLKLGDASYSTYLCHGLSITFAFWQFQKYAHISHVHPSRSRLILWIIIAVIYSHVSGWMLYLCVEQPLTSFFKRLVSSWPYMSADKKQLSEPPIPEKV